MNGSVQQGIVFALTSDDEQRARRLSTPGPYGRMMWAAIVLVVLNAAQIITDLVFSVPKPSLYLACFMLAGWTGLAISYGIARLRPLAREGAIRFSDDGISGTLNGEPMNMPWKRIASARDSADFIVIVPRRAAPPIAVPKSALDNAEQLWQLLQDRLVGKRSLVRSSATKTFIQNTAS